MSKITGKLLTAQVSPVTPALDSASEAPSKDDTPAPTGITLARRGEEISSAGAVSGFDVSRMRDRALLTAEEEKALMRRVDWRMMTICSILFLLKNIDADNISNARIMNKGTDSNIMTELNMTSDQYNLLNVLYYVSGPFHTLFLGDQALTMRDRFPTSCSKPPRTCC